MLGLMGVTLFLNRRSLIILSAILRFGKMNLWSELRNLSNYQHHGFWHPMDTLRDKNVLDNLWQSGNAPWKVWWIALKAEIKSMQLLWTITSNFVNVLLCYHPILKKN